MLIELKCKCHQKYIQEQSVKNFIRGRGLKQACNLETLRPIGSHQKRQSWSALVIQVNDISSSHHHVNSIDAEVDANPVISKIQKLVETCGTLMFHLIVEANSP